MYTRTYPRPRNTTLTGCSGHPSGHAHTSPITLILRRTLPRAHTQRQQQRGGAGWRWPMVVAGRASPQALAHWSASAMGLGHGPRAFVPAPVRAAPWPPGVVPVGCSRAVLGPGLWRATPLLRAPPAKARPLCACPPAPPVPPPCVQCLRARSRAARPHAMP